VVVQAGEPYWIELLLSGRASIRAVAELLKPQVELISAVQAAGPLALNALFRATGFTDNLGRLLAVSSPEKRTDAACFFGHPDQIWTDMIEPLLK
jgi:hypothetical protein